MPLLASIDMGTNTIRLLAAEVEKGRITKEVLNLRETVRLGEGLAGGGSLRPEARQRALSVLKGYAERLKSLRVKGVSVVATEALRKAADAPEFVEEVWDKTGLEVEIIPSEEEARRTMLGIRAAMARLGLKGKKLLVDIGGGSTELIVTTDWVDYQAISLPLGAVHLYERFIISDPPSVHEMAALSAHLVKALAGVKDFFPEKGEAKMVGTAGTVTTLAAINLGLDVYDPEKVTGHTMRRDSVSTLLGRLSGLTKENRRLIAGMDPGREDVIISGTAILEALMDRAGADEVIACDWGLREGNLLDYLEKKGH